MKKYVNLKEAPLAFIDLETTGFEFMDKEIMQIGIVIANQPDLETVEEIEINVKPTHLETADPEALEIIGYSEELWKDAIPLKDALEIVAEKTKGCVMVGHNVPFDWAFLEKAFEETGVKDTMDYHRIDTISIAWAKLQNEPKVTRFSLSELAPYFGIENKKAHTALSDARTTYELYKKLVEL